MVHFAKLLLSLRKTIEQGIDLFVLTGWLDLLE